MNSIELSMCNNAVMVCIQYMLFCKILARFTFVAIEVVIWMACLSAGEWSSICMCINYICDYMQVL